MEIGSPAFKKTTRSLVFANAACLFIAAAIFAICDYKTFENKLLSNLSIQAGIIGRAASQPLVHGRPQDAESYLQALQADPEIRIGGVYDTSGVPFALYKNANLTPPPPSLPTGLDSEKHWFENSRMVLVTPIQLDGRRIGYIYLRSSIGRIYEHLWVYAGLCISLVAVMVITALRTSFVLHREVGQPLIDISGTLRAVLEKNDYSLRASERRYWGELWTLKDRVNELLSHTQQELDSRRSDSDPRQTGSGQ